MWTAHLQERALRVSLKPWGDWADIMEEEDWGDLARKLAPMVSPMS